MPDNSLNKKNLVWFCSISVLCPLLLWVEGYIPLLKPAFLIYLGVAWIFDLWVILFKISLKRLIFLSLVAGVFGYITQVVGVSQNIWRYTGAYQSYFFVPFLFMFAAICMYGLSTEIFSRIFDFLHDYHPRWLNILLVCALFGFLLLTLEKPFFEHQVLFWSYYLALFLFAIYASLRMDLKTLLSLVLAAWIVGNLSEYLGSQSGLWIFVKDNTYPPLFLVFGSWPLEFILHYSLSAFLARESLIAKSFSRRNGS